MFQFVKKSMFVVLVLIAALAAVIPAFAGGPSDGFDAYLELVPGVNGQALERNSATGKYYVTPGTIFSVAPRFIGGKGDVVPPPVSKLGWDLSVQGAPGVVTPFRGGRNQKSSRQLYRANKPGFIYITGSAFSGDASVEFHRTAMETIVVSNQPAPKISLDVLVTNSQDGTAMVDVSIHSNLPLTNLHMTAESWYGQLRVWMRSDQGVAWKQVTFDGMYALEYVRASTTLYYQNADGYQHLALPDGVMSSAGLNLPITVTPESNARVSFQVKKYRG